MPWKECHVMDERLRFVARLFGERLFTRLLRQPRPHPLIEARRPARCGMAPNTNGLHMVKIVSATPHPSWDRVAMVNLRSLRYWTVVRADADPLSPRYLGRRWAPTQ
jgi:hypothetical protein